MSSHARTLTCSSLQTGARAKGWTWSITYSSKCMLHLSSRFIWNALSHARLFNIMSCHAIFESGALMMYRPVLKYSSPHFARQLFAFSYLHYPQNESMSVTPQARRDIALPSLLSVLCFLVIFLVFSCAWCSGRKWLLEEKVLKTDKHTQAVLHTRVAQGQTHLTPYRLKKLICD